MGEALKVNSTLEELDISLVHQVITIYLYIRRIELQNLFFLSSLSPSLSPF